MPDNPGLLAMNPPAVINAISHYIHQIVVSIQQRHPEWLTEKYRHTPWHQPHYQAALMGQLTKGFHKAADPDALLLKVKNYLKVLLIPEFMGTVEYSTLLKEIQNLVAAKTPVESEVLVQDQEGESGTDSDTPIEPGIAILLLDAENLQIDLETEKFLERVCSYPLQIKVAFANWRSLGKKDAEYHERGYQLIHVPPGKDSADLKMATVGASIFVHYPTAREIFICSSDQALTHLRNTLQAHGLTVYQVRKQKNIITVLNSQTGKTNHYSLSIFPAIPSLEQLLTQLKELIKGEQVRTHHQWIKLSRISALYQENHHLPLIQVVTTHFPGDKARDIFVKYPEIFAVHRLSEQSQMYVTLFDLSPPSEPFNHSSLNLGKDELLELHQVKFVEDVEKILVKILTRLTAKSPGSYIPISNLGSEFNRQYGQPITKLIKKFQASSKLPKFLELCSAFKLEKTPQGIWLVALKQDSCVS